MKLLKGNFYENELITIEIDGKQIERKVKYNRMDGLYIIYQNRKYFEYECDYSEIYKQKEEGKMEKKKQRPQDKWNEKNGLVSKTYKLQKEIADAFAEACEHAGTSKKKQLEKMMLEFIEDVNKNFIKIETNDFSYESIYNTLCGKYGNQFIKLDEIEHAINNGTIEICENGILIH